MSGWRGLHEQDYHSPWLDGIRALCTICQQDCEADDVCYCCQRNAEVERLTAEVEALRNSLGHCAAENATLRENDVLWRSRMKTAEAQVQRVREVCERYDAWINVAGGYPPQAEGQVVLIGSVLRALDGGGE